MVLAQKQTYRSMEYNRKPSNKLMHLWSITLRQSIHSGEKTVSSINGAGKSGELHVKR